MSLINDALKKAKQAQQQPGSPESLPHLKPVDPHEKVVRGVGLIIPAVFTLIALLVLLLIWEIHQGSRSSTKQPSGTAGSLVVRALNTPHPAPAVAEQNPEPVLPAPAAVPATAPTPKPAVAHPEPVVTAAPAATNAAPIPAVTNIPAALPPPQPELRLQSIVYNPSRPSAMIDGKPLFVGDKIRGMRIARITANQVTIVSSTRTNVLELSE